MVIKGTNVNKTSYFEKQIELIKNEKIKNLAIEAINLLPAYFFEIPASSTGKYHPTYALGEGGLLRHVHASVKVAEDLFRLYNFTDDEKDLIIVSLILHDGWKQGENGTGNTTHKHPLTAVKMLRENIKTDEDMEKFAYLNIICGNIATHMGQWTTSKWDSTVLPAPETEMEKFVHLCDYISSRRDIEIKL